MKQRPIFLYIMLVLLTISTLVFAWLAIRNAQPMPCDNVKQYADGTEVCERILNK